MEASGNGNCAHAVSANISKSIAGKIVYKDECAKCFSDNVNFLASSNRSNQSDWVS